MSETSRPTPCAVLEAVMTLTEALTAETPDSSAVAAAAATLSADHEYRLADIRRRIEALEATQGR